jgi:hypothetical protein
MTASRAMATRVPVNDKILARAHELLALKKPIPGNATCRSHAFRGKPRR